MGFESLCEKKPQTFFPIFTWNSTLSLGVSQMLKGWLLTKKTAAAAEF